MGGPNGVNDPSSQDKATPLFVLAWIEHNLSLTIVVVARARVGRRNRHRPAELFRAGREIERVYPLKIRGRVLAHCHHIDGAVRAGK